jgi:general secretion pathway protein G
MLMFSTEDSCRGDAMLELQRNLRRAARKGFTLMEMLVVVAIIVALAGIGGYYYLQRLDDAKKQVAATQTKQTLTTAVETYKIDHDDWPPSLDMLLQRTADGKGPYLNSADALIDPWGRPYQYNPQGPNNGGMKPDIWSESPVGQIGNWMARR